MTVEEIARRVEQIRNDSYDEDQHQSEDELHHDVLRAIAEGRCEDSAACAKAALATLEMPFKRWYS